MILVESLSQIRGLEALQLQAGQQGKKNAIRWPYIAENTDIEDWTKGGELIFVTGLNWNWTTADFILLIQKAQKRCASGLVILTQSPHLDCIPSAVLDFADQQGFPVFEQPYALPMVNVTELISNAIIMDDLNTKSSCWLLQHLADNPIVSEIDLIKASELGIDIHHDLSIAFIHLSHRDNGDLIKGQYLLRQFMSGRNSPFPATEFHQGWIAVLLIEKNTIKNNTEPWQSLHQQLLDQGFNCNIGISNAKNLRNLHSAVSQAKQSAEFGRISQKNDLIHYNSLGIAQLFTHIENDNVLHSFCRQHLGEIFNNNDKQSLLLKTTLRCYFDNLCSMRKTALVLSIHRNTLSKRLEKIEILTGVNLNNAQQRLSLQIALTAERFIY